MPPNQQVIHNQSSEFLDSLDVPAFVIVGWKKSDEEIEVVQCVKDMDPIEYAKGMGWALHQVMDDL